MFVAVLPVHAAAQSVVEDILALDAQRALVLIAHHHRPLAVGEVGHHALFVPAGGDARQGVGPLAVAHVATSVEGHAHHQFLRGDACRQMSLHGL